MDGEDSHDDFETVEISGQDEVSTTAYIAGPSGTLGINVPGSVCQTRQPNRQLSPNQDQVFTYQLITESPTMPERGTLDVQVRYDQRAQTYDAESHFKSANPQRERRHILKLILKDINI